MEQPMQNQMPPEGAKENKMGMWLIVGLAAAVVLIGLWLWMGYQSATAPESEVAGPALSGQDTTGIIEAELQATDLGDIESEFQGIEAELQNL
jgi:hypothetical protein